MRPVLVRLWRASGWQAVTPLLLFLALGAIVQGVAFTFAVPIAESLFRRGAEVPWGWIAALLVAALIHAVLHYRSVPMGNKLGADLVTTLHHDLAEQLSRRPTRTLDVSHADRLASLDGTALVVLMGLPAHILRPLVAAVATPVTVIVITAFIDVKVAAVLAVGMLALVLVTPVVVRLLTRDEEPDGAEWLRQICSYPARSPRTHAGPALRPAAGEVMLWRVTELALCGAVALCVAIAKGGGASTATKVGLVILSVLTLRAVLEAVLLTSTVMNSYEVMAMIGRLADPGTAEPPSAEWPERTDVEFAEVEFAVDATTVLSATSFRLPARATTAIVGAPDGVRLLLGELLAGEVAGASGRVLIGGVEVGTIAVPEIERNISRVSASAPALTRESAEQFVGSQPLEGSDGTPSHLDSPRVRASLDRLRRNLAEPAGSALGDADRWRLALLRTLVEDPEVVIVDGTAGSDGFAEEPDLADLLSALAEDRTCWLVPGPGFVLPPCDEVLLVEGTRVVPKAVTAPRSTPIG
ncbi:hypothetical protein AB0L75_38765 [Streptomyces sp. NPDC052101]|uniref:hypothetical protein n=1 Tax=Streptomyces sp. NPDC052101 TaxID=3155763 RepID=UPI003428EE8C